MKPYRNPSIGLQMFLLEKRIDELLHQYAFEDDADIRDVIATKADQLACRLKRLQELVELST